MWGNRGICSWQRIGVCIAAILTLSVTQIYFVEFVPVAWFTAVSTPSSSLVLLNKSSLSAADPLYRGAQWRPRIGRWLLHCDAHTSTVSLSEKLYSSPCKNNCNGNGVCNRELGTCRCFHGFTGSGCDEYQLFECNNPAADGWPFGGWGVSICSSFCDKSRAMCFCGEGSAYPTRPVAESCGFVITGNEVDWKKSDSEVVHAPGNSSLGWCNVNPAEYYSGKVKIKEHCDCKYDCSWGLLCETPTECSCINQCSGNGVCRGGFCQCQSSWFGIDCSVPSVEAPLSRWPDWLRPASLSIPERSSAEDDATAEDVLVEKKRPLIYVYDLPPTFDSHLLEGRHFKFECVNRIYDGQNNTVWSEQLRGAEIAILESLLASPHRTMNGDEADFFYVPVLGACAITRADDAPHFSMEKHMGLRNYFAGDLYKGAHTYIQETYPFWNRTSGRDHIWFFSWDEGACPAPKEIWNSTMLVHWGNTNSKYNRSTTAYRADSWNPIPSEWRGDHPCYDPAKDIVLPAWKRPDPRALAAKFWSRPMKERNFLFYFNGDLGKAYHGRPEDIYSMGIRQKVAEEFGSTPNVDGKMGKQAAPDVVVTARRSDDYADELSRSRFCGVFPGDGWSGRMEDAVLHGCIPVIIQDGIHLPYENVLDYQNFTVRLPESEIPQLVNILRNISDERVESMLTGVQGVWERFVYKNAIMLEAQRQLKVWNHFPDWSQQHETLTGDDAFATFIQVLHYKLHNDEWRSSHEEAKSWGVPASCTRTTTTRQEMVGKQ